MFNRGPMPPEKIITILYETMLNRAPDPAGLESHKRALGSGDGLPNVIRTFINSEEFFIKYVADNWNRYGERTQQNVINLLLQHSLPHILHAVRVDLINTIVPTATTILDLGGAHSSDERGALLAIGYPHAPQSLQIIDLPPKDRFYTAGETTKNIQVGNTKVTYHYQSMADLQNFPSSHFDLIWSGETIEHISYADAMRMLPEIKRILKPDGVFALDTPNRRLTRIQVGDGNFTHPEHLYEYGSDELVGLLEKAGFRIRNQRGLVHLPKSHAQALFDAREFIANASINDDPLNSYVFYVEAVLA